MCENQRMEGESFTRALMKLKAKEKVESSGWRSLEFHQSSHGVEGERKVEVIENLRVFLNMWGISKSNLVHFDTFKDFAVLFTNSLVFFIRD